MKKRLTALLLVLMLLVGMMAGCGSSSDSTEETETAEEETVQETEETEEEEEAEEEEAAEEVEEAEEEEAAEEAEETEAEPEEEETAEAAEETAEEEEFEYLIEFPIDYDYTITVSMSTTPSLTGSSLIADDGSELGWAIWLEERTGVNIEVDLYSFLNATDKQALMIASGDYTDLIMGSLSYSSGVDGAVEDEVLVNIAEYAEYMPDYMNTLFQDVYNVAAAYSTDFNLTAFYGMNDPDAEAEYGMVIRQDWLDELGLDTPVTYDDLHDVLVAFKENYGATLWVTSVGGMPGDFSGGYGIMEYSGGAGFPTWVEDGEYKFAATEEDTLKEYLTMMHEWYEEGLIYADFLSQGDDDYPDTTLINNGTIGVWSTYASYLETEQDQLTASDADGVIAGIAWPVVEEGQEINVNTYGKTANNSGVDGQGCFSVTTAGEDIGLICAVLNEFYTEEGRTFANWGIEGEHYVVNDDGSYSFTELITNDEYNLGANIMMTYYFFKDGPFLYDYDRYLASYSDMQLEAVKIWTTEGAVSRSTSTLTTDQSSEMNTYQTDLQTVYQEYTVKFITGAKDLETDWDEFLEQLNGCGLERFMEIGQMGVDQYDERLEEVQVLYDEYWNS